MEFKVVKINEAIKNAVVSHKALIESDIEAQRAQIIGKLEKGQVLEGTVKNITDFGAFMVILSAGVRFCIFEICAKLRLRRVMIKNPGSAIMSSC